MPLGRICYLEEYFDFAHCALKVHLRVDRGSVSFVKSVGHRCGRKSARDLFVVETMRENRESD